MISYDESTQVFHLANAAVSYLIHVLPTGNLEHVYYGPRLHQVPPLAQLTNRQWLNWTMHQDIDGEHWSNERLRQELPTAFGNDFREPALAVSRAGQPLVLQLQYQGYTTTVPADWGGLPHPRQAEEALTIQLRDADMGVAVDLTYLLYADSPVIARSYRVHNLGTTPLTLDRALSSSIDLTEPQLRLLSLQGSGMAEFQPHWQPLSRGTVRVASVKGDSSCDQNPFVALAPATTTETTGRVFGQNLMYSGNFETLAQTDPYAVTRVATGINHDTFSWELAPDADFQTPVALLARSDAGLNGLSQAFSDYYRLHVMPPRFVTGPRPVLANTWEAFYMDINEQRVIDFGRDAFSLGCNLVVIDDGWFTRRHRDDAGLGDWAVDREKFPHGLRAVSDALHALGGQMGIWIEPESINPDSDLFRAHPEWVATDLKRPHSITRTQYLLDMANPAVIDDLTTKLLAVLADANADYVKWDMNRNLTEPYSHYLAAQGKMGEFYHRYMLGVYELYRRLQAAYPDVLFESCASGGDRWDAGMLYYAPQGWLSDNTDAYSRQLIQSGASYAYPPFAFGAHVSAVPNAQTGRTSPLRSRIATAMFGTFGYELDLAKLDADAREQIKQANAWFKAHAELLRTGHFNRLGLAGQAALYAWETVAPDASAAVIGIFKPLNQIDFAYHRLRLVGLDPAAQYDCTLFGQTVTMSGEVLMQVGLDLTPLNTDGTYRSDFVGEVGELVRR